MWVNIREIPENEQISTEEAVMHLNNLCENFREKYGNRNVVYLEMAIHALQKDIARSVISKPWSPDICPTCGSELSESLGDGYYSHPNFLERCPACQQKLEWK